VSGPTTVRLAWVTPRRLGGAWTTVGVGTTVGIWTVGVGTVVGMGSVRTTDPGWLAATTPVPSPKRRRRVSARLFGHSSIEVARRARFPTLIRHARYDFRIWQILLQKSKIEQAKKSRQGDLRTTLSLRRFSTPLRRRVIDSGWNDVVPHLAAREAHQRL